MTRYYTLTEDGILEAARDHRAPWLLCWRCMSPDAHERSVARCELARRLDRGAP